MVAAGICADDEAQRGGEALLPSRALRRASPLTRALLDAIAKAVPAHHALAEMPMVFGSAFGEMQVTCALLRCLEEEGMSSPALFHRSVHNVAAGLLSITVGFRGFAVSVAAGSATPAMALLEAMAWLHAHGGEVLLAVGDEAATTVLHTNLSFAAVAAAFVLSASLTRGVRLESPRRIATGARPAGVQPRCNPCAGAVHLAQALRSGHRGVVPLSPDGTWVVDIGEGTLGDAGAGGAM